MDVGALPVMVCVLFVVVAAVRVLRRRAARKAAAERARTRRARRRPVPAVSANVRGLVTEASQATDLWAEEMEASGRRGRAA
jgi:hypothetical protein